jgi:hypothetical protein
MKTILCLASLAALLLAACSKESSSPAPASGTTTNASAAFENPLNAPADYGKALVKAQKSAEKTVDLAALTKAIEMFQVDKGRLPKDLNELVAGKFIRQMPPVPPGMKIDYDASTGEVKVQPQ